MLLFDRAGERIALPSAPVIKQNLPWREKAVSRNTTSARESSASSAPLIARRHAPAQQPASPRARTQAWHGSAVVGPVDQRRSLAAQCAVSPAESARCLPSKTVTTNAD